MRHLVRAALALTVLTVPLGALAAQLDSVTQSRLQAAPRIRLLLTTGDRFDARFQAVESSVLVVQSIVRPTFDESYFVERRLPLDSLARIWGRQGTHSGSFSIAGGIVFASLGAVMAAGFRDYSETLEEDPCALVVCMAGGALGGGLLGWVVGGVLGALFPRWVALWP
jgi:hypothetical protein